MKSKIHNPFKNPSMVQAFDTCIKAASEGGMSVVDNHGVLRRRGGGSHRCAFWDGYENAPKIPTKDSIGYACYRAGKAYRKAGGEAPEFSTTAAWADILANLLISLKI